MSKLTAILIVAITLSGVSSGQVPIGQCPVPVPPILDQDEVPKDDVKGNYIIQELDTQHPFEFIGNALLVCNPVQNRIEVWTRNPLAHIPSLNINVGLGPVACHLQPGTFNLWVVNKISGAVSIIDLTILSIVESIQVGSGPQAMTFVNGGAQALVVCEQDRVVNVIDVATRSVTHTIAIEGKRPCGIVAAGNRAYVIPRLSGNNTTVLESAGSNAGLVMSLPPLQSQGVNPLPDIDIHAIDIDIASTTFGQSLPGERIREMGTILFDIYFQPVTASPGGSGGVGGVTSGGTILGDLIIPNTDALNAEIFGQNNAINGQVVQNRVTKVSLGGGAKMSVQLDTVDPTNNFAQPTGMAWDAANDRWYVFAEGSDTIAVLDQNLGYLGAWNLPAGGGDLRHLPHAGRVIGTDLMVFCRASNSLLKVPTSTPFGSTTAAPARMGSPLTIRQKSGLSLLANADLSGSGTSSCQSCHIFSDLDGLAWMIAAHKDPEGANPVVFWTDLKGPMVTQSLNALPETAPYHWRGEQENLAEFNGAFEALLDGNQLLPSQFATLQHYVDGLHYPANSNQQLDRDYTAVELEGARIFMFEDAEGPNATCATCHQMPLATNGELMLEFASGFAKATQVTQLRGVHDKELGVHDLGSLGTIPLNDCTLAGVALDHQGVIPSLFDFAAAFPAFDACEATLATEFMKSFDTGLAPASAHMRTLNSSNPNNAADLQFMMGQADIGNIGLYLTGYLLVGGNPLRLNFEYKPGTNSFRGEQAVWGNIHWSVFVTLAGLDTSGWTAVGTPVGQSRRAIDTDYDGLFNIDENIAGTNQTNPDSDGDTFPDGHEVAHGDDPTVPQATSSDGTPPAIVSVTTVYTMMNTVKLHIKTSEPVRLNANWSGILGAESRSLPDQGQYDDQFDLIVNFLGANSTTNVALALVDPAGNASIVQTQSLTTAPNQNGKVFVENVTGQTVSIAVNPGQNTKVYAVNVTVDLRQNPGLSSFTAGPGQTVHAFVFFEDGPGNLSIFNADLTAVTNSNGQAVFNFSVTGEFLTPPGDASICFGVTEVDVTIPGSGYVEGHDKIGVFDLIL